jgi:phosphatidate cytidylyltransferase
MLPASKLQQRVLTALLIVPLPVAAVLLLPTSYLALFLGVILQLAAWEWAALAGISSAAGRVAYAGLVAACLIVLWQPLLRQWIPFLIAAVVVFWVGVAVYLLRLRRVEHKSGLDPVLLPVGLLVLVGPWAAIAHLHAHSSDGRYLVLFLLVLIWVADIMAYFTGRQWGREKLAPVLSPGKTRVGVYGALIGASLLGVILGWHRGLPVPQALLLVLLCALAAFVSVIGDLFESLIKRRRQVKDSGQLLPGHGGVLDRIDSVTAAAPLFTLGLLWLEAQI